MLDDLIDEYERALSYTESLWRDLTADEVRWRPVPASSAIGWHLGHQAAVAHFMIRNLTASEPSPDPAIDPVMDSSFPEERRDEIPDVERLDAYRTAVIERVRARMRAIREGRAGAPEQMAIVAATVLTALVNHEYQHDTWIAEVRCDGLGHTVPPVPVSPNLVVVDGYPVLRTRSRSG
jgi:hypothetical protein